MIYITLKGGLGNVLFQIAAAKSLSIDNNVDFCVTNLDEHLKYLNNDNHYNPNLKYAEEYKLIFPYLSYTLPITNILKIDYPFEFRDIKIPKQDVLIDGFFQSEKYFKHNKKEIIDFLSPPEFVKEIIKTKYSFINNVRTTSIHVRRGDYLHHEEYHPTQTLEYYKSSIEILKDNTDLFVVFSDDINWCKENLKLDNILYIEGEKDYIELYLMSMCDNNIIANSSFSWWGAWLNQNEDKIVIGPTKWFGPRITSSSKDIIPDSWIKI